ncbi:MAG: hypothetical protein PUP93_25630 [Rhizonema sp. NSF051]|nr:hypothetical protein [Rhizonema sp. NSF051]
MPKGGLKGLPYSLGMHTTTWLVTQRFLEPLKRAIVNFQTQPNYREHCYKSLMVKSPVKIIDGIDLLAGDFHLPATERIFTEQQTANF